ncbi:hypothetical protein PIIN_08522 [Serendipita indica DSM 11827]|uniref:Uncharacterized protein n=1 Tax=Serendipita indica (strain DSM 11827) TaxID=1109443 RepID=G4TTC6_SERID|nr:hypothetical protein PIIN_08522 [Serendipita indica DSM 11827]
MSLWILLIVEHLDPCQLQSLDSIISLAMINITCFTSNLRSREAYLFLTSIRLFASCLPRAALDEYLIGALSNASLSSCVNSWNQPMGKTGTSGSTRSLDRPLRSGRSAGDAWSDTCRCGQDESSADSPSYYKGELEPRQDTPKSLPLQGFFLVYTNIAHHDHPIHSLHHFSETPEASSSVELRCHTTNSVIQLEELSISLNNRPFFAGFKD